VQIAQLISVEPGWRAVFSEPDGSESLSRIVAWAVVGSGDGAEIVGVIVDPSERSRIAPAPEVTSPGGGSFGRYRYIAPEPAVVTVSSPATEPEAKKEETAEQMAKGFLKRRL
jgi:hypothetical protein